MIPAHHPGKQSAGFSLLEVLVAFSIATLALAVLMDIFSTSLRSLKISDDYNQALAVAESVMELALASPAQGNYPSDGTSDTGYVWHVLLEPHEDNESANVVRVEVNWGNKTPPKQIVLTSLQLAGVLQ